MKTYVLYHANCMDGFGAALCAWLKFGDKAEYIPCAHGQPMPAIEDGSYVYILDFSFSRTELEQLWDRVAGLDVIDHHATARTELEGLPFAIFDMNKSGARLAWEYFHPQFADSVPDLIRYIEDRDLWKWSLHHSKEINAALGTYEMTFPVWNSLLNNSYLPRWIEEGTAILRALEKNVKMQCKNAQWAYFHTGKIPHVLFAHPDLSRNWNTGYGAPVVNATCHISEVGHELLQQFPASPFVGIYLDKADGSRMWSLRSRPDFDCSFIAKAFGGGGHKQACGFTVKD
jgi:uncharacterized protein